MISYKPNFTNILKKMLWDVDYYYAFLNMKPMNLYKDNYDEGSHEYKTQVELSV